jgi:hypothetical protein
MGVTISHGAYAGSYSGFHELRRLLFRLAGYDELDEIDGFTEPIDPDDPESDGKPGKNLLDVMRKSDGLYPLYTQGDDQGVIAVSALPPLARRLRELVAENPDAFVSDEVAEAQGGQSWRQVILAFAEGCDRAHAAGQDLVWDTDFMDGDPPITQGRRRRFIRYPTI